MQFVFTAGDDGLVGVHQMPTDGVPGTLLRQLHALTGPAVGLVADGPGRTFTVGSTEGNIKCFNFDYFMDKSPGEAANRYITGVGHLKMETTQEGD